MVVLISAKLPLRTETITTFGLTLKIRSVWCRAMTVEVVFPITAEKHGPRYTTSLPLSFTAWTLIINSRIESMQLNRTTPASAFRVPAHTEQSRFRNALCRELEKAALLWSNRMIRTLFISEQSVALPAAKGNCNITITVPDKYVSSMFGPRNNLVGHRKI